MNCFKVLLFLVFTLSAFAQKADPVAAEGEVEPLVENADAKIAAHLRELFGTIDALAGVEVIVQHGVVTLEGKILAAKDRDAVIKLTSETEGVVYVQDQIEEEVEVEARLKPAIQRAEELGADFLRKLPIFIIALLCIVIFWIVGSWAGRRKRLFQRLGMNDLAAELLRRVIKLVIIGVGIFIALEILDATAIAAGILGVAGVAGVALGFAFRNIVENYLAGVLLSMRNPFSTGDAIEVGSHVGKVIRLTSRDTVLMTFGGNHLRIPNSVIMTSVLTNYSRNPLRRFDFVVGVSTAHDLVEVRELGLKTLLGLSSVLADPKPNILIENLGDSTVNLRFFSWVDQRESDFGKSKSEAIRLVKVAFDEAQIEMPEPIYRVHLREPGSVEPAKKKPEIAHTDVEGDVSVDDTIDRQVEAVAFSDQEDNLLADEGVKP